MQVTVLHLLALMEMDYTKPWMLEILYAYRVYWLCLQEEQGRSNGNRERNVQRYTKVELRNGAVLAWGTTAPGLCKYAPNPLEKRWAGPNWMKKRKAQLLGVPTTILHVCLSTQQYYSACIHVRQCIPARPWQTWVRGQGDRFYIQWVQQYLQRSQNNIMGSI